MLRKRGRPGEVAQEKLFAGFPVRRLRRRLELTQAAMAEMLGISASYLNLVERNARPVSATVLLRLAEQFDFDPRTLSAAAPAGGRDGLRRRLADPLFADLEIDRSEVDEWLAAAPGGAEAFARAFDRAGGVPVGGASDDAATPLRREITRWSNHFADLDAAAEAVADELRLGGTALYDALAERLRVRHSLSVRVLPVDVMPDALRRLDLHARQVQLSELLDHGRRTFALATQVALMEARADIDALVRGAEMPNATAGRLYRRHLASYFAAALVMPYSRFLRACEATGYDLDILMHRFGASFEQVAHRLTTLGRVGARGLPFFLLRIDRAGQTSKRYPGAGGTALVETEARCPLWNIHDAFARPGQLVTQLVALEGGDRFFTMARTVTPPGRGPGGVTATFAVALGLDAALAGSLTAARGVDLTGSATPIGLGCRACLRPHCPQRSCAPAGRALRTDERDRGVSPFRFDTGDPATS